MKVDRTQAVMLGVILAMVAGFAAMVWWPMHSEARQKRDRIKSLESKLSLIEDRRRALGRLEEEVERLRRRVETQTRTIAPADQMPEILRQISLHIEASGLEGEGITTGEAIDKRHVRALPVELTVGGPGPEVFRLIRSIESMPRLVQVDRLKVGRLEAPGYDDDPTVHAELRLTAYLASQAGGGR